MTQSLDLSSRSFVLGVPWDPRCRQLIAA